MCVEIAFGAARYGVADGESNGCYPRSAGRAAPGIKPGMREIDAESVEVELL